jgi:hypothetical protein
LDITPTAGAGSPREGGSGAPPSIAAPLALCERITGAASPLIGRDDAKPAGVALRLAPSAEGSDAFDIALVDAEARALMVLGPFPEDDVVAVWRSLAGSSGLPLLLQDAQGALQSPFPQIGAVQLGEIRIRRLYGLLKGRRPRFLVRRKAGRLARRPHIHCEREIIAGSGA